jgi:hypothetical protein
MVKKPTTIATGREPNGKTSNSVNLVFPLDRTGFTTVLRKEGARAVGRIGGDDERLAIYLSTLRVLGDHAKAKLVAQKTAKVTAQERADALVLREQRARADEENTEINRLEKLALAASQSLVARLALAKGAA